MLPDWYEPKRLTPRVVGPHQWVFLIGLMRPEADIQGLFFGELCNLQDENYWKNNDNQFHYDATDVASLFSGIVGSMEIYPSLCAFVSECVLADATVRDAIQENVQSALSQVAPQSGLPVQNPDLNLIDAGCADDVLYGQALYLVRYFYRTQVDILERVEVESNKFEVAEMLLSAFPPTNYLGADELTQYIDGLISFVQENYMAQYTESYEEELACEIFCVMRQNCQLSVNQLFSIFQKRLNAQLQPFNLLLEVFQFVATGAWTGNEIVDAFMLLHMAFIKFLNTLPLFFQNAVGTRILEKRLRLGALQPSTAYTELCDECPSNEWMHEFNFQISQFGWTVWVSYPPLRDNGSWISGIGWQSEDSKNWTNEALYIQSPPINRTITSVELDVQVSGIVAYTGNFAITTVPPSVEIYRGTINQVGTFRLEQEFEAVHLRLNLNALSKAGQIIFKKVRLTGRGTNPFI